MGQRGLASNQKKTSRLKGFLVFLDESGFLMAPLVRRTWSPAAQTPVLYQRSRRHKKVSVIAAICIPPARDRVFLYFRLHADVSITSFLIRDFLRCLLYRLPGPVVLLWDRLQAHRGRVIRNFIQHHPRLHTCFLPPYAPELNPVEYVWSYLKMNPLANHAVFDLETLVDSARHYGKSLQRKDHLLRSFIKQCPLSFCLK
jgi:hypothetical protein